MPLKRIGPYRIDREIGSGGMGVVFAATVVDAAAGHCRGDRVAVKIVHPHLLGTPEATERFRRELAIGRRVHHPNVVRTLGGGVEGDAHFLVMEYVEGQTLAELRDELERIPEDLCRHVGREIAQGLAAIHAAGAVHRDVKPENVLITEDHVVKLMDLGVARAIDDVLRLSQTGAFVGSLRHAAPEQFAGGGRDLDGRTDLHALGLLLYEIASGSAPYAADDLPAVVRKVLHAIPRRLGELCPQVSPFFEEVVHCLLEKDRELRFQTADEVAFVLGSGEDATWWRDRVRALQVTPDRPLRRIRIPRETAVHGREEELRQLRTIYEQVRAGDGRVVLVEGEAGIGKSRLVDELVARLQQDGEEIDFLFGAYPPGGAATAAGAFSTAYRERFGATGSAPYLTENRLLVPAFDAVLRGDTTPPGVEPLTKDSLQTCFVRATQALAQERVVVVLIDDLHFAPVEGRALFTAVALAVVGHRILLLGCARPGVPEDWVAGLSRLPQTTTLELTRLGPADLVRLLGESLGSDDLATELAGQVAVKSDGNPFFAFEILRGLREGRFIARSADGQWTRTRAIGEWRIPSSVQDLVNARVAELVEEERDLLDVAACCGFEFDPALIAAAVGAPLLPTLKAFGRIERRHRLVRACGRRYVFDHHQVREALYGTLFEPVREAYHAALAESLERISRARETDPAALDGALCVDLCEHFLAAARGHDALRYLSAARSHLAKGYRHAETVTLTERALAVPDLLTGAARARELLHLCRPGGPLELLADADRQVELAREAERLATAHGDRALLREACTALGACFWRTSRTAEAERAFTRARDLAVELGDGEEEAAATGHLGLVLYAQGRLDEARAHYDRSLELGRQLGLTRGEAFATLSIGNLLFSTGRHDEARIRYERYLVLSRELGDRQREITAIANLGLVALVAGRLDESRRHQEAALALSREIGDRFREAHAMGSLGELALALGRLDEARAHEERALALAVQMGHRQGEASRHQSLGKVFRDRGDLSAAEEHLVRSIAICDEIGWPLMKAFASRVLGSLYAERDGGSAGAAELETAREIATTLDIPGVRTLALCELALLPEGAPAAALDAFDACGDRLADDERIEVLWLLWRATGDIAHLAAARQLVEATIARAPESDRTALRRHVRVHREILAAWSVTHEGGQGGG